MKKQSVRRGLWYIGSRRNRCRQRGRYLPIGALATPILGSLGGVVIKKYLEAEAVDVEFMYRNKILFRRKVIRQRVTLSDGRSF